MRAGYQETRKEKSNQMEGRGMARAYYLVVVSSACPLVGQTTNFIEKFLSHYQKFPRDEHVISYWFNKLSKTKGYYRMYFRSKDDPICHFRRKVTDM